MKGAEIIAKQKAFELKLASLEVTQEVEDLFNYLWAGLPIPTTQKRKD